MLFNLFGEHRSNPIENPSVPLSAASSYLFGDFASYSGETVTEETAMGVPAIAAAVNIQAGTIASLPLHLYRYDNGMSVRAETDPLYRILHDRPNATMTSFSLRKWMVSRLLLGGRSLTLIVRNRAGRVMGLYGLNPDGTRIEQFMSDGVPDLRYIYTDTTGRTFPYASSQIIDLALSVKADGFTHVSPIEAHRNAIGGIIAVEKYAAQLFAGGGVPPVVLNSPSALSPEAATRASKGIEEALKRLREDKRSILIAPAGHRLETVAFDPMKQQMIELRQFQIAEVARIFNIAPAMLHDLTRGTYSNVEQQNLHYTQHTIAPLVKLIEQELNAKLFTDRNRVNFVEFNLDGLMRGDFATRMEGLSKAVSTALLTPNEARALDNRQPLPGGDDLLIQGATIPLHKAGETPVVAPPPTPEPTPAPEDESNPNEDPTEGEDD
ncbi:MAG TPA: phage portal protein [Allosphingosinicella sp.]|jgi:HK97 family phage portal protein